MNKTLLIAILTAIVIIVIVLIVYFLYIHSTTPIISSAVSSSVSLYQQQFEQCAAQYAQAYNTFIKESPMGLTQSELQTLANLQQCMNNAAAGIANVAKSLNQNPLNVVAQYVGEAILTVAAAYGISQIVKSLRTYQQGGLNNGGSAANVLENALIRYNLEKGLITQYQAASASTLLKTTTYDLNIPAINIFSNTLVEAEILTIAAASALAATVVSLVLADTEATIGLLSLLLA